MSLGLLKTTDFIQWYEGLGNKEKLAVDGRLDRIVKDNHFGTVNRFDGITELKWNSGLRVYTALIHPNLILLLGGNKNGQEKDIRRAKRLLSEIVR